MKKIVISLMGALIFAVTLSSVSALSPAESDYYSDVWGGDRYFTAIEFISDEGIVNGYDDGTYKPDGLLNRAELLKIIIEAEYVDEFEPYANSNCFDDVTAGEWFTSYVCFAKDQGFVVGYDDGTFRPTDKINLVEAVKIAMEVFGYEYEETDPWYKGPVDVASDGNFIPLGFISFDQYMDRGEMADLITRVLKSESGEQADYLGIWNDSAVSFDNLSSNASSEPTYCAAEFSYMLAGSSYIPWDNECSICTCQADGSLSCTDTDCADTCAYGGELYDIGDEFPAEDGCNTCTCIEGQYYAWASCTEINCPTCEYGGETYNIGDEFPAVDSCNTCTCEIGADGATGGVSCTEINCPDEVICTDDAFICPDGSSVGRSGPDCEFDPCPGSTCEYGEETYLDGESVVQGTCAECTCDNGEWVDCVNFCI